MSLRSYQSAFAIFLFALPCLAQELQGRFYSEKDTYMLGEPALFNIEIKNPGRNRFFINAKNPDHCVDTYDFLVSGDGQACNTQWNDYCLVEQSELAPGDSFHAQWPLNHWFQFETEGKYHVSITRHIPIRTSQGEFQDFTFSSKFDFAVVTADPVRVQGLLQDFERNLQNDDPNVRHVALDVLSTTAPAYFQSVALRLLRGDDAFAAIHAAVALGHMNTPETRAALAEVITAGNETADEGEGNNVVVRARALDGLGTSEDPGYLGFVEHYLHDKNWGIQLAAMKATAELGRSSVVPEFEQFLQSPDPVSRRNAAWALQHSANPEAVDALISALDDKDSEVREHTVDSLKYLTGHQEPGSNSPENLQTKWRAWWRANRSKVKPQEFVSTCHFK
jgi:hypothetical protein